MKLPLIAALGALGLAVHPASAADDDHGHTCACEAEEFGFKLDCANTTTMTSALEYLKTNGCAADCPEESECHIHFLIIQSHHDYCPEADIPEAIEDGLHDFEDKCPGCDIRRAFTEGAPDCPAAVCDDESGPAAYTAALDGGCLTDCTSDACKDSFTTLRVVHDSCPHDTLSSDAEKGLHDLEKPCKDVVCNAVDGGADQLACVKEDGEDHASHDHASHDEKEEAEKEGEEAEEETGSGAAVASAAAALVGAVLLLVV